MREFAVSALFLSVCWSALAQAPAARWIVLKDSKGACQIAVPPDWTPLPEAGGAAVFHDPGTGIAVVTSQPGQTFQPLSESQLKMLGIGKEKLFENSDKRLFYQDKTSRNADDPNSYSAMVPGKGGTCSYHVTFLPSIAADIARRIALSLGPATEGKPGS